MSLIYTGYPAPEIVHGLPAPCRVCGAAWHQPRWHQVTRHRRDWVCADCEEWHNAYVIRVLRVK